MLNDRLQLVDVAHAFVLRNNKRKRIGSHTEKHLHNSKHWRALSSSDGFHVMGLFH